MSPSSISTLELSPETVGVEGDVNGKVGFQLAKAPIIIVIVAIIVVSLSTDSDDDNDNENDHDGYDDGYDDDDDDYDDNDDGGDEGGGDLTASRPLQSKYLEENTVRTYLAGLSSGRTFI